MNTDDMIFVFGSNEAGRHGLGAAAYAMLHKGAEYGVGVGMTGQSYAIPTKDNLIQTLPLAVIENYVNGFLVHAAQNPHTQFQVTAIGCGLAGYSHAEIAPLFAAHAENCFFDTLWHDYLPDGTRFWGTF